MLRKTWGIGLALTVAVGVTVAPIQAQRGVGSRGQGGPNMGRSLELALESQEQLELTGAQVAQLQELKDIIDGNVLPLAEEMKNLRDQIQAGEVARDEGWRQMEAIRGELITAGAPLQGRVQEILTVAQHNQLQPLVRQDMQGQGRGMALQGRGMAQQGRAGARRGGAGQGRPGMGRGVSNQRGRGMGAGGMQGQLRGGRGGFGPRQGINGQGRAPAFGLRQAVRKPPPQPAGPGGVEHLSPGGF